MIFDAARTRNREAAFRAFGIDPDERTTRLLGWRNAPILLDYYFHSETGPHPSEIGTPN
jgi:hypothetical protein